MKKIFSLLILLSFILANQLFAKIPPPNQIYPTNGAINIPTTLTFDWSDLPPATLYQIMVNNFNGDTIINQSNLNQSQYTVPPNVLSGSTTYYWKVRATNGPDINWSGYWSFITAEAAPAPPVLIGPCNLSNVTVLPTFSWNPSATATYYRLQVSTDQNFGTLSIDAPGLTSTQYVVTPSNQLAYGTMYYWRVNASNGGGTSGWSNVCQFSTIPAPPPPPTLQSPPNHAVNVPPNSVILSWSNVPGADGYWVQLATDNQFYNKIIDQQGITSTQYVVPPNLLSGSTTYYWHVASHNTGGYGQWSGTFDFTTMLAPPAAPILIAPPDSATNVPRNPDLDWGDVPTATSYLCQVSTDPNFATTVYSPTVSVSHYQIPANGLNVNTRYYWRVRATNSAGTGEFSSRWTFVTIPAIPPVPTLSYPSNNATGLPLSFTFRWLSSGGADDYQIQVSQNSGFGNTVVNLTVTDTFYTVPPGILVGGVTYYWHVRAHNQGGYSNYSTTWSFTTMTALTSNLKVYLEGFYNQNTQTQVQDTIRVYLAQSTSPYTFKDSAFIYLSTNGTGSCSFAQATNGNYYIVIRHRNHLETWSSSPQAFILGNPVNYDFTTASNKAYGNNMKQVGSVWVLYGGDINQDGQVFVDDYNILVTQFGKWAYLSSDLNGDTFVDGYDLPIIYSNFFKSKSRP
jgi:hypothetical protein